MKRTQRRAHELPYLPLCPDATGIERARNPGLSAGEELMHLADVVYL